MGSATPTIITVVAVVATIYAGPVVGQAILSGMGVAGASAATTAAVGAAAIGGATSAVNSAIAGGNVEDVLKAGAIGAATSAAGSVAGAQLPPGTSAAARGAVSGATSGAVGSALRGQDVGRGALVGGVSGGVSSAVRSGLTDGLTDPNIRDVEAQEGGFYGEEGVAGASTGLSPELARFIGSAAGREAAQLTAQNLAPSQTGRQAPPPTGQVSTPPPVGDVTTTGQPAPGSSALAQALRAGSPVIGGGEGTTSARPVWNIASLRVKDETGS